MLRVEYTKSCNFSGELIKKRWVNLAATTPFILLSILLPSVCAHSVLLLSSTITFLFLFFCRMLHFTSAFGAGTVRSDFIGSGPIWMDNVQCTGREFHYSLEGCTSRGWGIADCDHRSDATVTCDSEWVGYCQLQ